MKDPDTAALTNPPDLLSEDDLRCMVEGKAMDRERLLIERVQAAYDRGWDEAAAQWEMHVFDAPAKRRVQ